MTYEEMYGAGLLGLNKLAAGSGLTEEELKKHLLRKPYNNQTIVNNSVSDATDGYHIRSGKDYGQLADGNLPLGGIPAALAGIAYQQLTGIKDSSLFGGDGNIFGTVGPNAFLQSVDNIEGLRQSGNAPALDAAYDFGGKIHNLFNKPSEPGLDITALGGPGAKGNVFNSSKMNVEDYSTTQQRVQAERAAQAQAQAQAAAKQQQILADQTRMQQQQTTVVPEPVKQTVINTPSNQTKFGANRSTAIKGGRGGRGNYSKPAAKSPSPVFKSYGPPNMQRFR